MIAEIQCLPFPPGTPESRFAHIEAAIRVIQESGLRYEVGKLGTTVEGTPDEIWPLLRQVHEACVRSGASAVVSILKLEERA